MGKNKKFKNYITTANLRLRKNAGFDKETLLIIPKGDRVTYRNYTVDEDWYFVKYKDSFGYCLK